MRKESISKKRKNDIVFIGVLFFSVCIIGIVFLIFSKAGDTVTVTVGKTFYGEYSLDEDCVVEIRTDDAYNILVIENGRAYIREASCPDGICSAHHPISRDGESIICLPNRVVITVSAKTENVPDIIA